MAKGHSVNKLLRNNDMSALTLLVMLLLFGLWPLVLVLIVFGFIGSFMSKP